MSPLDGAPRIVLSDAELRFLRGMPADRSRIKQHVRALQRRQARALGIPLVPANQRAEASGAGVESAESEVAGREIELFVIERIVRDVHFAIKAAQGTVTIEDGGGIVVDPGGALFEQRRDQDDAVAARRGRELFAGRAGNGFSQIEQQMIFALAEILRLKKLGQADDLRTPS